MKAPGEYRKTRKMLHIMKLIGRRNTNNTLICIHLVEQDDMKDFHFATAKNETDPQPLMHACIADGT